MMEVNHGFQVSAEELGFLRQLAAHDESFAKLLRFQEEGPHCHGAIIRLNRDEAEQLRDCLTKQLAEVGFDQNYSPNEQGQILEKLIDRFYLR